MQMAENRQPREAEARKVEERPKQWVDADMLPEPDKQAGYSYRWVRVSILNSADPRNISGKLREGWEPVPVEEQPQYRFFIDRESRYKDHIEIGGLLLCKMPTEFLKQRAQAIDAKTNAQTEAVDNNYMRQSDSRMPLFRERKSSTSFGTGK
jgi:hypothetical protein